MTKEQENLKDWERTRAIWEVDRREVESVRALLNSGAFALPAAPTPTMEPELAPAAPQPHDEGWQPVDASAPRQAVPGATDIGGRPAPRTRGGPATPPALAPREPAPTIGGGGAPSLGGGPAPAPATPPPVPLRQRQGPVMPSLGGADPLPPAAPPPPAPSIGGGPEPESGSEDDFLFPPPAAPEPGGFDPDIESEM